MVSPLMQVVGNLFKAGLACSALGLLHENQEPGPNHSTAKSDRRASVTRRAAIFGIQTANCSSALAGRPAFAVLALEQGRFIVRATLGGVWIKAVKSDPNCSAGFPQFSLFSGA